MSCLQTVEQPIGNIYVRPSHLVQMGDRIQGHTHNFDHTTFILKGGVHCKATLPDGRVIERDFWALGHPNNSVNTPGYCLIRKDVLHEFTALEDDTYMLCVYAHRNPQGEVVQQYTGWPDAYR